MRKKISTITDYLDCNQQQLINHLNQLEEVEKSKLIEKLETINIINLKNIYDHYQKQKGEKRELQPIQTILKITDSSSELLKELEINGLRMISEGKVCIAMMAGGQGTRLGFNKAKGMYNIGLPSHKSLFQIFCERILSLQNMTNQLCGKCLPIQFFIMTSDVNHQETTQFFIEHNYFGLQSDQITFFQQDSLPILSLNGEILLSSSTTLLEGPDGNGGIFNSLHSQGYLDYMKCLGIKYIHICPVDNVLCKLADPIWIGYMEQKQLKVSSKSIKKINAQEKVGIHALINNLPTVVEYSEMLQEDLEKIDEQGNLIYNKGGIAQMICTVDFVNEVIFDPKNSSQLAANYHGAQKKYEFYDYQSQTIIKPLEINSIKFELFFFDVYPLCLKNEFGIIEVEREDEFGPVKNAPGEKSDTPETAKQLYLNRDKKWLKKIGYEFNQIVEISSKATYFGEGLENILPKYKDSKLNPLIINLSKISIPIKNVNQQLKQKPQKQNNEQKSLTNSVQIQPLHYSVQPKYYHGQPIYSNNILIQENPIVSSQIFKQQQQQQQQQQHSLQNSQTQLKHVQSSAFPIQKVIYPNQRYQNNNVISPRQNQPAYIIHGSLSPQRMTTYAQPRGIIPQRQTMFGITRPQVILQPTYIPQQFIPIRQSVQYK